MTHALKLRQGDRDCMASLMSSASDALERCQFFGGERTDGWSVCVGRFEVTLPETNSFSPLKMDGWNATFFPIVEAYLFSGAMLVSGRVSVFL